jgi:uncharacterized protein YjbI with pentapeptide repeats
VGGYWAIQDLTFNARGTFGNRILTTTPNKDSQLLIDPSITFDGLSLLQFPPISGENLPALPLNTTNRWSLFFEQPYVVDVCGDYCVGQGVCTPDPNTGFTTACATAAGSTMDGTVFNSAYLFGVDFTKTTAQGVDFGNAILTGANFNGATLTASTSGTDSGFSGAFLQGTNMAGLTLPNGISLQDAFVDFTPAGNVLTLILGNFHTTFADYWNTPGEPVCAQMTYNGPTTIPATNGQVTCPDGHQYTNGCGTAAPDGSNGRWESPVDITTQASYLNNATYTNAPASGNPICTADILWVPLALEEPPPIRHRPSPHPIKRPKPKPPTTLP